MRALVVTALAGLVLVLAPSRADCDPPAGAVPEAAARAHLERGKADLDAHLYDPAIAEFTAADAGVPQGELLFELAQAYRLSNKAEAALDAYHKYLADTPAGALADAARVHVAELTKALADSAAEIAAARATWQAARDTARHERVAGVIVGGVSLPLAIVSIIALATGHHSGQVTGAEALGITGTTVGIVGLSIGMPTCFVIAGRTDPGEFQAPLLLLHPSSDDKAIWLFSGQF